MSYLRFVVANWHLLGFAFLLSFGSSFGQTFYISLSSAQIREAFDLTHGGFGLAFTVATLASGVVLVWAGRLIDRLDLRLFSALVVGGLVAGMAAMSVVGSVVALTIVLFVLRICGQGLMIHTASTTLARYLDRDRGKALSVGMLGQPAGEAVLPLFAVGFIAAIGWRDAWLLAAAATAAVAFVLLPLLLRGQGARHAEYLVRTVDDGAVADGTPAARRHWTRGEVLRDPRFFMMVPMVLAFPFIGTGFFFHQVYIAETRGWPIALLASAFVGFAIARVVASLVFGPAIDRYGAARLVTLPLAPLVVTLVTVIVSDHWIVPVVYLAALGVSVGMLIPLLGAVWAELYGTRHIGAIKAQSTSIVVLGSATSPAVFGFLIDHGVSIARISVLCLVYVVAAGALAVVAFRVGTRPEA
ncbi:MAG: MFS transporter [Alphaproteobacteria bacterium]|jgi:MFS family permease